ncbi:hypothetical protein DM860_015621 [Cuscuta australis]|uniref:BRCT domain-containing protein n=1 Tax=Cuscuta australis TaxID=267555 RepID=A0A328DJD7_9ASTE|nr:hypothetical protein DM860_015621 [Cuscuta australis]
MRSSSASTAVTESRAESRAIGPFSGLIICVTGLSKEARMQVMKATEKLGGTYSPQLHPHCTHLVHALKHGSKNGLSIVTLGWIVDSVKNKG